jgi:hypothetical protein
MRDGIRVYDADTHVNPTAEILERYVAATFRTPGQAGELADEDGRISALILV